MTPMLALITVFIFIYGIVIGSFLNVCIYRIPQKEDIVRESSHCMSCGHRLKWYDLVPLFSYLFLKGKCRYCGSKLSKQYPIVEALNGILYVVVFYATDFSWDSILYCLMTSALIVWNQCVPVCTGGYPVRIWKRGQRNLDDWFLCSELVLAVIITSYQRSSNRWWRHQADGGGRAASRMEVDYSCICDGMYCGFCGASVPDEGMWCRQNAGAGSILIGRDIYCGPVGKWDDRLVSGTFYVEKSDYKWKVYEV